MTRPRDKAATAGAGHTPGTWEVRPASYGHDIMAVPALVDGLYDGPLLWVASVTKSVGAITRGQFYPAHAVCDANARLIAAAPTMRAMVIASAHAVCSAAAYSNTSVERRWLRDRWLVALDTLGLTEEQARAECHAAMRGIYATPPSQAPDATGGGL